MTRLVINTILTLSIFPGFLLAQNSTDSTQKENSAAWQFRGKILGGALFEDWYLLTATTGIEKSLGNHHSIGFDLSFLNQDFEQDLWDTTTDIELGYGYSQKTLRYYMLADYRFYVFPEFKKLRRFNIYLNLFGKAGTAKLWTEAGYKFDVDELMHEREKFYEFGSAIGVRFNLSRDLRVGLDFNMGISRRFVNADRELYQDLNHSYFVHVSDEPSWIGMSRLNLYCYINRP